MASSSAAEKSAAGSGVASGAGGRSGTGSAAGAASGAEAAASGAGAGAGAGGSAGGAAGVGAVSATYCQRSKKRYCGTWHVLVEKETKVERVSSLVTGGVEDKVLTLSSVFFRKVLDLGRP